MASIASKSSSLLASFFLWNKWILNVLLLPRIRELRLSLVFVESQFWVLHIMKKTPIVLVLKLECLIVCSYNNHTTFFLIMMVTSIFYLLWMLVSNAHILLIHHIWQLFNKTAFLYYITLFQQVTRIHLIFWFLFPLNLTGNFPFLLSSVFFIALLMHSSSLFCPGSVAWAYR